DRLHDVLVEQMRGRLELVRPVLDQPMAEVSASHDRNAPIDVGGGAPYDSSECEVLVNRLIGETEHYYRPGPTGFVQVVERDECSVIQRVVAGEPSDFHLFIWRCANDRLDQIEIVGVRE